MPLNHVASMAKKNHVASFSLFHIALNLILTACLCFLSLFSFQWERTIVTLVWTLPDIGSVCSSCCSFLMAWCIDFHHRMLIACLYIQQKIYLLLSESTMSLSTDILRTLRSSRLMNNWKKGRLKDIWRFPLVTSWWALVFPVIFCHQIIVSINHQSRQGLVVMACNLIIGACLSVIWQY